MSMWYLLDKDRNVTGPVSVDEYAKWSGKDCVRVGKTQVYEGCEVSTVFLGLDHRMTLGRGNPIVFETLVFGGPFDGAGERYGTWAEAEAGHARYVEMCQPILTEDAK